MRIADRQREKGVALLLSILALMLLTAIAMGMMYMSTTETTVNGNFKAEETQYFAARGGVEEVRDRMRQANVSTINDVVMNNGIATCANAAKCLLPTFLPGAGNPSVLYVLQNGVTMANVTTPPAAGAPSPWFDDELCHDSSFNNTLAQQPANVRCTAVPAGTAWYGAPQASVAPYALDYKWVRVTLKENRSTAYPVDPTLPATNLTCWNGISEVVAPTGTAVSVVNNSRCGSLTPIANPVYLVTALAVSPSGARRLVQQELAQFPSPNQPGGLFATGSGCGNPLNLHGNMSTYSFNSALESTPTIPSVANGIALASGGNVGANGSIAVTGSSASVNGNIASTLPNSKNLGCPASAVSTSGSPTIASQSQISTPYTPPVPPLPNPLPPQSTCDTKTPCWNTSTGVLPPGQYGNIKISAQTSITLQGGTVGNPTIYNINSLSEAGQASISVSPAGPVVINIAGVGQTTVLDLTGGGFTNNSYVASNLVFNYGGTGAIAMTGGSGAFFVLNAPKASLSLQGNANFYGQANAATIDVGGNPGFYWDVAANAQPTNNNPYYEISMRELSY
jgi:hypothetical protein